MNKKIQIARLLRKEQTKAEKKLWGYLRNRQFKNLKFRRQYPIKNYIVDFFCEEYGIVIELDGEYHNQPNQSEQDLLRDVHLTNLGYTVLRFENKLVFDNIESVFLTISNAKSSQKMYALERRKNLEERKNKPPKHLTPTPALPSGRLSSRRGSNTLLSTKALSKPQQELFLNAKLGFVHYNAINIAFLEFEFPKGPFDYFIFTSQNGVHSFLANHKKSMSKISAFCVGEKTKALLKENGLNVIEMARNSLEMGKIIQKKHKNKSFLLFSGNLRRQELPLLLKENNIRYIEVLAYRTTFNEKEFTQDFDGILFFSPSAVQSFTLKNSIGDATAFCIGETTAAAAKKYTNKIIVSTKTTIENTIVQAVKHLT